MDWYRLDALIDEFERLVTRGGTTFGPLDAHRVLAPDEFFGTMVHDWGPVWAKAEGIQAAFNSGVLYPGDEHRDQSWSRFNDLRNELLRRANSDRERTFSASKDWRDRIMDEIEKARPSRRAEMSYPFDAVTAEDIAQLGEHLREASRMLSDNKLQMLREHKDECLERIQEIYQIHDAFWGRHEDDTDARRRRYRERIETVLSVIESNIKENGQKKTSAKEALERAEEHISRLYEMLDSARGDDDRERIETRLTEARARKDSIEDTIRAIDEWIGQDERRRADILNEQR